MNGVSRSPLSARARGPASPAPPGMPASQQSGRPAVTAPPTALTITSSEGISNMNRQAVADIISENKFDTIKTAQITAPTQASVQTNHCSPLSDRNSLFHAAGHKSSLLTETGQMFTANIEAPPRHSKRLLEKRSRSVAAKPNYTVPAESSRRPGRQTGK